MSGQEIEKAEAMEGYGPTDKRCPVCGEQGRKVTQITLTAHLRPEYWHLSGPNFWFCWTPKCPILYYDNSVGTYVSKDPREVRSRFGLKEVDPPRPICHCLGVTMERILDEVVNKRCCDSLEDVERFTRAGTGKWCLITNPSGVCCRAYLKEVVAEALMMGHAEARPATEGVASQLEAEVAEDMLPAQLQIEGMDCESCTFSVAAALEHAGATDVKVSFKEARARFNRPTSIPIQTYLEAVSDAGYSASRSAHD